MVLYEGINPKEAFAESPPEWAKDKFNYDEACSCPYCGAWMEVVRPGKCQPVCDCQDD